VTGRLADVPVPRPLRRPVWGAVSRVLGMDLTEARYPVTEYRSLDELFVRPLRVGARRWPAGVDVAASPVDGVVGAFGRVDSGELLQAKGRRYTVAELLDDTEQAERFRDGAYLTLYLAPRHYHRIHAPVAGQVAWARHIPGRLLPVNQRAVGRIDRLFPRNERLVAVIEPSGPAEPEEPGVGIGHGPGAAPSLDPVSHGPGAVAVVAVGAFNVGRITADFDTGLLTNRRGAVPTTHEYDPPLAVGRGDGIMAFHLGSTVVLLFERPVSMEPGLQPGAEIRLGDALTL
jgi:phosphatidylserine decarboxylase